MIHERPKYCKSIKRIPQKMQSYLADVVSTLKECSIDVADKTVYGWENGRAQPDLASLLVLCDLYHIHNILDKFGYTASSSGDLSTEERLIIYRLRQNKDMMAVVKKLLDIE